MPLTNTLKTEQIHVQTHDDIGDAWDEVWRLYDKTILSANSLNQPVGIAPYSGLDTEGVAAREYAKSVCDRVERAVQNICECKMDEIKCIICPSGSIQDYVNKHIISEGEWALYFISSTKYKAFSDAFMLWVTETDNVIAREVFKF